MTNILSLLNINFETEYRIGNYPYRYDFYFNYNGMNYLIEMDGAYGHGCNELSKMTIDEQIFIDNTKDKIASENDYIMIRIDCKYRSDKNKYEYVRNNIISSQLNDIFDISNEILDYANLLSQTSNIYKLAELWNSGIHSYKEISDILHIGRPTIRKYAKQCIELKLIDCNYNDFLSQIRLESNKQISATKGHKIICEQTNEIFNSMQEAMRIKQLTSLPAYFYKHRKYCGKLEDGTKLTWRKL